MEHNDDIEKIIDAQDLTLPPPEREPQRQYYFIKKCREFRTPTDRVGRDFRLSDECAGQ